MRLTLQEKGGKSVTRLQGVSRWRETQPRKNQSEVAGKAVLERAGQGRPPGPGYKWVASEKSEGRTTWSLKAGHSGEGAALSTALRQV